MNLSLRKKLFDIYNFSKVHQDYTISNVLDQKIEYYNLEKVLTDVLFYKKKLDINKDINEKYIIIKDDIKYINLEGILELSKLRNDYRMCLLHIDLELSTNEVIQDLDQVISNDIKYSEQSKFTYVIFKFLQKNYPEIRLMTEEYLVEIGKSYRCDILLPDDNVRIIIEHYESFHKNNKYYDGIRQETFEGLGYSFLKFNEGESIRKFINVLDQLITDRMIFLDSTKDDELIIKTLIEAGCDRMIASNMYQLYKIGDKYEIKFSDIIMSLGYSEDEYQEAVEELKFKISEEYYEIKENEIYLNSTGYKLLLLRSSNPMVYPYQEYYIRLEKICYDTILRSRNQAKKMYENMQTAAPQLIKYGRDLADKILIKSLEKSINKTQEQKKLIKYYEQERKKMFKIKILEEEKKFDKILKEGDIIVPYIPSLVFTNDINEEVDINQIKSLHKVFKDSFSSSDKLPFKSIIDIIKKRLNIENISSYDKIIPNCKIIK